VSLELLKVAEEVVKVGFRNLAMKYHANHGGDHK